MKYQLLIILVFFCYALSKCSFFAADESTLQKRQSKETPMGTMLSVIKKRHLKDLSKGGKHWNFYEYGCSEYNQRYSVDTKSAKPPGYNIKGLLDTRYYFFSPEYVFVTYCFNKNEELTSVIINVEVDGI